MKRLYPDCSILTVLLLLASVPFSFFSAASEPEFQRVILDKSFRSEGASVADINQDGHLDVLVGDLYYVYPDWQPIAITTELTAYDPLTSYSQFFGVVCANINDDSYPDFICLGYPGRACFWYENPGKTTENKPWARHKITDVLSVENPIIIDIDQDGKVEIVGGWAPDPKQTSGPEKRLCIFKAGSNPTQIWDKTFVSEPGFSQSEHYTHGLGVGDINQDGKLDIVTRKGYFLQPEKGINAQSPWQFVPVDFGSDCAQMLVYDFDSDGKVEVITTSTHNFGIWLFKQNASGDWQKYELDKTNSQTHSVVMADLNQDGKMDIVTGKRWKAHNGKDPGTDLPAELFWLENRSSADNIQHWIRHTIDTDSGVGMYFEVTDINGDGKPDIAVSNKKGVSVFLQK